MIYLDKITKRYDHIILNQVSYKFEYGKIYVIKGVSGSGKTTLLNILGLIDNEFEGRYFIDGIEIDKHDAKKIETIRSKIGYVYQDSLLFSNLNIKENLTFFNKDENEINDLVKLFKIELLLDKMPNQLSNGERQRVSIIRAILGQKDIIICDEPTASLDRNASECIVSEFEKLKNKGKVIIISTHEDVFDTVCDECIFLDYGVLETNQKNNKVIQEKDIPVKKKTSFIKEDIHYSIQKCKKNSIMTNLMLIIFCLILFISIGFRFRFESVYRDHIIKEYPYYTISAADDYIKKLDIEKDVVCYEDYHFNYEDVQYYSYLPYKDSSLRIPDVITTGEFPNKENEVIINYDYYQKYFKGINEIEVIGKNIIIPSIESKTFIISGILSGNQQLLENAYYTNPYYQDLLSIESPIVFIDYATMKKHSELIPQSIKLFALKDITDKELIHSLSEKYVFLSWETLINEKMFTINMITNFIFVLILILSIIVFLFVYNFITLDLYYRRKEIGYLRLFSMSKKRLNFILKFSYFYKVLIPLFWSILIYIAMTIGFKIYFLDISLTFLEISILSFILLVYVYILTYLPIKKMLKSNIKELLY